jgi:hypothetical protein
MPVGCSPEELERLLAAAASDPASRPAFADALLHSDVLVLGTIAPPMVDGIAQAGSVARLFSLNDAQGPITPFFTSEPMLQRTLTARPGTDPGYLRLSCRAFFEMTAGSRLVLNPDAPYGKVYLPDEVAALLEGREPGVRQEVLDDDRQVLVGSPAHVPSQLPEILARFFVQRPAVVAAHLGWIVHPDGRAGYLLVVVATDERAAMAGFGTVQITEATDGNTIDVMVVEPGRPHILASLAPFYSRPSQVDLA